MLYKNFVDTQKNKNMTLAKSIFTNNKSKYAISGSSENAYATIIVALKSLLKLSDKNIKNDVIIDGYNDGQIDAIYIDDRNKIINVFEVKETNKFERNDVINIFLSEFKRNFLDDRIDLSGLNNLANKKIKEAQIKYFKKYYEVKIYIVRTLFVDNCQKIKKTYEKHFLKSLSKFKRISVRFINTDIIINKFFDKSEDKFNCNITFDNDDVFCDSKNKIAIGKIKVSKIIKIIEDSKNPKINYNIFDDNVRDDQENETLDDDLKQTLKENPERFFLFHNGITMSCLKLKTTNSESFDLTNPQVLNGCQSLKSLQRIYDKNKKLFNNSTILCRLFEGKNNNDINSVCQSTNSQRPITTWDLRTNDIVQKILEEILSFFNYSYNRKRNKDKNNNKIYITDLAQWISACMNKEPAVAKSSKKKLFDVTKGENSDYNKKIFRLDRDIKKIVILCDKCIFIKKELKKIKMKSDKDAKSFLDHADFHIMSHVYNFGKKDIKSIKTAIKKCKLTAKDMKKKHGEEYSYNNIFKNPETWTLLSTK